VSAEIGTAAACSKDRVVGFMASLLGDAHAYCANEPSQVP
jgi:hypothetical protein